jgi:hypothetical protein
VSTRNVASVTGSQQFDQLMLYMTPREILTRYHPLDTDRRPSESAAALWQRKLAEAQQHGPYGQYGPAAASPEDSLLSSVARNGVLAPVHLGADGQVYGGHHRLAAAAAVDPNQPVPVMLHSGTVHQAQRLPGYS